MKKINEGVTLFERIIKFSNKYSILSILKAALVTLIIGITIYVISTPEVIVKQINEYQMEQHDKMMKTRENATIKLHSLCQDLLYSSGADRVWIIEFHNGKTNMANGLPFDFGIMTIEHTKDGVYSVQEEYKDFPVSYYPLIYKVYSDGYWYGTVDELKSIDKKLYYKMLSNNTEYLACLELYSDDKPLAILGVSYVDSTNIDKKHLGLEIRKSGMQAMSFLMGQE